MDTERFAWESEWDEQEFLTRKYFYESGGNTRHLECLLMSNCHLTPRTRTFIAMVLSGQAKKISRFKKKCKLKKNYFRDLKIHRMISELLAKNIPLTSNAKEDGAAAQVAYLNGVSEETALKVYERMQPKPPSDDVYV